MDVALDKAIKEIIGPVIQRSVTIASRTTKELILKVKILYYFSNCRSAIGIDICITGGFICNRLHLISCRIMQWNLMMGPFLALHI